VPSASHVALYIYIGWRNAETSAGPGWFIHVGRETDCIGFSIRLNQYVHCKNSLDLTLNKKNPFSVGDKRFLYDKGLFPLCYGIQSRMFDEYYYCENQEKPYSRSSFLDPF